MYGRRHGLVVATARGSARPKSKQAARLEPLTFAEVMVAKGKAWDHLAVAAPVSGESGNLTASAQAIGSGRFKPNGSTGLSAMAVAGAFADMFLALVHPGVADERLFVLWEELASALASVDSGLTPLRARLLFAAVSLRLMDLLGYGPRLSAKCGLCHEPIGPTDAWYAPDDGVLICAECATGWRGGLIRAQTHALALLKFVRSAPLADMLRVSMPVDVGENVVRLARAAWRQAPLEREPHGFETIEALLA